MKQNKQNSRISIQVGLDGYSFKAEYEDVVRDSGWMSSDKVFTTREFQRRYDEVNISLMTPKFVLVPKQFYAPRAARNILSEVVLIEDSDSVDAVSIPELDSYLIFSNSIGETLSTVISDMVLKIDGSKSRVLPEIYYVLEDLKRCKEYNKIIASYSNGWLYLTIAQGKTLLLCNAFKAQDFVTAEYFIFMTLKKLQLNPEMSVISFRTPLSSSEEMSLYRYFRAVEFF